MNTYQKITNLTPAMVAQRVARVSDRINAAMHDMGERKCRRAVDGVHTLTDMPEGDWPALDPLPANVRSLCDSYCVRYHGAQNKDLHDCVHLAGEIKAMADLSPVQLVTLIEGLDAYAAYAERRAAEYRDDIARRVAEHASANADACRKLVGLVAV